MEELELTPEECEMTRNDEIECLKAIFMDEFQEIDDLHFRLNVVPPSMIDREDKPFVSFVVSLDPSYPNKAPSFTVRSFRTLSIEQEDSLEERLKVESESRLREPMLFDLSIIAQEAVGEIFDSQEIEKQRLKAVMAGQNPAKAMKKTRAAIKVVDESGSSVIKSDELLRDRKQAVITPEEELEEVKEETENPVEEESIEEKPVEEVSPEPETNPHKKRKRKQPVGDMLLGTTEPEAGEFLDKFRKYNLMDPMRYCNCIAELFKEIQREKVEISVKQIELVLDMHQARRFGSSWKHMRNKHGICHNHSQPMTTFAGLDGYDTSSLAHNSFNDRVRTLVKGSDKEACEGGICVGTTLQSAVKFITRDTLVICAALGGKPNYDSTYVDREAKDGTSYFVMADDRRVLPVYVVHFDRKRMRGRKYIELSAAGQFLLVTSDGHEEDNASKMRNLEEMQAQARAAAVERGKAFFGSRFRVDDASVIVDDEDWMASTFDGKDIITDFEVVQVREY